MMDKLMRRGIAECIVGELPVIITLRHDGFATHLCGDELPLVRDDDKNDYNASFLGWRSFTRLWAISGRKPSFVYNKIMRNRCSEEIWGVYFEQVLQCVRHHLKYHGSCFVFDLHRFYKHPPVGNYAIFLGTDHRKTVDGDTDKKFAAALFNNIWSECRAMLQIYVPGEEEKDGERFMATGDLNLSHRLKKEEPRVQAIQVEFYKDLLADGDMAGGLANALAAAILDTVVAAPK